MNKSKTLTRQQIDDLLEDMIVDAHGDSEQLTAMQCVMEEDLGLPVDVFVAGTPMSLVGIDYDGNSRRILELNPMDEMDIDTTLTEVLAHQPINDHEV